MNENEKKLFYSVLKDKITEEPAPEQVSDIMRLVHKKALQRALAYKILEIAGYVLLGIVAVGFLCGYLYFYTDFKLPVLNFSFVMPSKIYIIMISIIFGFSLVDLFFRKRLYESG
jgi:hypothetical protein